MLKAKSYHKSGIPDVLQLQTFPFFNLMWRVWLECFAKHFFEVWSPLSPNSFQEYLWCSGIAVLIDCMGCNFNFMWLCDINGHNRWSHVTCFFLFSECIFLYFLSDFFSQLSSFVSTCRWTLNIWMSLELRMSQMWVVERHGLSFYRNFKVLNVLVWASHEEFWIIRYFFHFLQHKHMQLKVLSLAYRSSLVFESEMEGQKHVLTWSNFCYNLDLAV